MTDKDRVRWDNRYASRGPAPVAAVGPPPVLAPFDAMFPTAGHALDLACGRGLGAVWLARRGMDVWGFDVSPVAIGQARDLARRCGVGDRCRFDVVDLDNGLPAGPPVDSHPLPPVPGPPPRPGGRPAPCTGRPAGDHRAERGRRHPGPLPVAAGELAAAFADLDVIAAGEGPGRGLAAGTSAPAPLPSTDRGSAAKEAALLCAW